MKLIEVSLRFGFSRVLVVQDPGEIAADHEQRWQRLARSAQRVRSMVDCLLKVTLASGHDAEGDARFGVPSKSVLALMTSLASILGPTWAQRSI